MRVSIQKKDVKDLIRLALREDIGAGDVTSSAIFKHGDRSEAVIIAKEKGIICGVDLVRFVYEFIDSSIAVMPLLNDGVSVAPGTTVIRMAGPTIALLSGERTALNFIQRMSGIATRTARVVAQLSGTGIRLLDTRKTLPGFRKLDKYAVETGGGTNHRMGLYDMVMIKDNHIRAAGGIARAVRMVRDRYGTRYTVEVEAANLLEVDDAIAAGADIIMLDNMDAGMMREAANRIDRRAQIEISGTMDEEKIQAIKCLQIDFISMGSLTHSVSAFDLSMEFTII